MNSIKEDARQNLIFGFKKCEIFPLNKQILSDQLPQNVSAVDRNFVGSAFLEQLDVKREDYLGTCGNKNRKKN